MDFSLQITNIPVNEVSNITAEVDAFFKPKLRECSKGKWHKIATFQPTSLAFLVRINKVTLEHLKATLRRIILDKCKIDKKSVIVKKCPVHLTELLNKSPYNQIPENAADSPPVSTLSVGAAATSSIQNFGDGGGPGTETKLGKSSAPPSLVSSGSGQQQACIMANQLQAAAAARGDASGDSQGRNSESDDATLLPVLCFTGKRPTKGKQTLAYSSAKVICVLNLNASESDQDLDAKLNSFRAELNREIQALSFEAVIDAELNRETFLLRVKIVCTWKTPRYAIAIRRSILHIIETRLRLARKYFTVKIWSIDAESLAKSHVQFPSGSRWLQHSPAKGSAYTMPIENFVLELGKEVRAQEAQYLKCETQAQFMADGKAKQVLLANLHDVLRWRFPHRPPVLDTDPSAFCFQQQAVDLEQLKEAPPVLGSKDSRNVLESLNPTSTPNPTSTGISPSLVAGAPALTPFSNNTELSGPAGVI
jgi:hypothetical protein